MPDNSAHGGGDSASSTLKQQVNADLFGDDGAVEPPAAADGGAEESGTPERPATDQQARDRTAASVFGDLRETETDDVDAVFDHYGVDSTEEVLSAEGSGADTGWSTDPVVIGEDDGGFGDLLLDDRDEGEEFNWVAAAETAAGPSAAGDARPAEGDDRPVEDDDRPDDASAPESRPDDDRDGDATGSGPGTLEAAPGGDGGVARDDGVQAASADEPGANEGEQGAADAEAAADERPGLFRRVVRRIASLF